MIRFINITTSSFRSFLMVCFMMSISLRLVSQEQLVDTNPVIDSLVIEFNQAADNRALKADLAGAISSVYNKDSQYRQSIIYALKTLDLSDSKNYFLISEMYMNLGDGYDRLGIQDSAYYYVNTNVLYLDELARQSKGPDYKLLDRRLMALKLLANNHVENNKTEESLAVLDRAIELIEGTNIELAREEYPEFRYGHVYELLGIVQLVDFKKVESIHSFEEFRKEALAVKDDAAINVSNFWLARVLIDVGDISRAIRTLKQINHDILDQSSVIRPWHVYGLMAKAFFRLDQYDSVRFYADKSLVEALKTDDYTAIAAMYQSNTYFGEDMGDWEWAYENYKKMVDYEMFLKSSTDQRNLGRLENQYESQKAQNQLNLELASQKNRNTLIVVGAIALLLINILILRSLRLSKKARLLENVVREKLESDRELEELKKEKLSNILEFKNRQLATTTLSTERLNSQLSLMIERLSSIDLESSPLASKEVAKLIRELNSMNNQQDNWAQFYKHFESVHPNFFNKLIEINSDLTQNELRHCAYVMMGLSNKEVANMSNISPNSVKTARNRLKKKLGLEAESSLTDFIIRMGDGGEGQYLKQA